MSRNNGQRGQVDATKSRHQEGESETSSGGSCGDL